MKVVKKKVEDDFIVLDVTASTAEVSQALHAGAVAFCKQMGIRPLQGKTLAEVAADQMGIRDLDSVVTQQAIDALVPFAIEKFGVVPSHVPTAEPKVPLRRGHAFRFELHLLPKASYELTDYSPVSFTAPEYKANDAAIDQEINRLAQMYTTYVAAEPHPVAKGEHCKLAIEATKNGEPVEGLNTDGRTYSVGEGLMPDGFDEGIVGMSPGETKTITFDGPGLDENNNEVMEEYVCKVTLIEIQKEVPPVIDDEWVAHNMPMYKGLEELRADIAKHTDSMNRAQYDDYLRGLAAEEIARRFDGKISDAAYEGAMHEIQRNIRNQVAQSGQKWDDFVEQNGGQQQLNMMLMLQTRQQLVQGFALDAVYRHFALSSTDADVLDVCRSMNPQAPQMVRDQMQRAGMGYALRESAARLVACKYLVDHADIRYVDREQLAREEAEARAARAAEAEAEGAPDIDFAFDSTTEIIPEIVNEAEWAEKEAAQE